MVGSGVRHCRAHPRFIPPHFHELVEIDATGAVCVSVSESSGDGTLRVTPTGDARGRLHHHLELIEINDSVAAHIKVSEERGESVKFRLCWTRQQRPAIGLSSQVACVRPVIHAPPAVITIKQATLELGCAEHKLQLALRSTRYEIAARVALGWRRGTVLSSCRASVPCPRLCRAHSVGDLRFGQSLPPMS